jgi:NTE family protein
MNKLFSWTRGNQPAQRNGSGKRLNLALQGGGAHGAFTWGVIDLLLEDGRVEIEGLSGASAGALNAVMLADGLARGGPEEARKRLADFWRAASVDGGLSDMQRQMFDHLFVANSFSAPMTQWMQSMGRFLGTDANPLNINPLKRRLADFHDARTHCGSGDGFGCIAAAIPRRRNRRPALLGRWLHVQPTAASVPADQTE